jgi:hypothetical protein
MLEGLLHQLGIVHALTTIMIYLFHAQDHIENLRIHHSLPQQGTHLPATLICDGSIDAFWSILLIY